MKKLIFPAMMLLLTACTSTPPTTQTPTFTIAQVGEHKTKTDCWMAIDGKVYDITPYFGQHPAGDESLARGCGKDDTVNFNKINPHKNSAEVLSGYFKGDLAK